MAAPKVEKIFTAIVLDFETGGTDPKVNGITQIAMSAVRMDTFEVFAKYESYVIPYEKVEIAKKKAVKRKTKKEATLELEFGSNLMDYDWKMSETKIGISEEMCLKQGKPLEEVVDDIIEFAKKAKLSNSKDSFPIIVGQNINFDVGFLHQIFAFTKKTMKNVFAGIDSFHCFLPTVMDTQHLARMIFAADESMTSYQLEIIAERLGIDLFDAHSADADVEATSDIFRNCAARLRSGNGDFIAVPEKVKTRQHFNFYIDAKGKGSKKGV